GMLSSCWMALMALDMDSQQCVHLDVVFLLDGSDGTRSGFPAMRDFVQRVVETLSVDDNKDRVSVVQYSRDPAVQFYLNTYKTKGEILDTVRGLRHKGGRPLNTGAALQHLRDNVFTASAGSRRQEGVPQLLIVLSGGRSFDSVDAPASALKDLGVITYTIGSRASDSSELQKIAHEPSHALSVSEFTDLPDVQEQFSSVMSKVVMSTTHMTPTGPGKKMIDFNSQGYWKKICDFSFRLHIIITHGVFYRVFVRLNTIVTSEHHPSRRDVVFLLDGSDGTRSGFPAMRDFVQRVVETLSVDDNKDRVSVVQYSRDPAVQFYLNTYKTKGEILDTVRGLRHKGGRPLNTGAALQHLRDNVFTASAGSRRQEGVPQLLIVLSGGRSFDSVDAPASALKDLGVITYTIGSRASDSSELQKIAHEPSHALSVSEFTDLPDVQEQFSSVMNKVLVSTTHMTPTGPGKKMIDFKGHGYGQMICDFSFRLHIITTHMVCQVSSCNF
uniref:VWFA domain-containing protein n=1 Tax=Myripristis murdjan TaxID=586833 RepID=A0A667ZZP9_9TELE